MGGKPALATGEIMNFETIMLKKEDHVATLTLNRPEMMNAVNFKMFEELKAALNDINEDDNIRLKIYLNRLSDYLFVLARKIGKNANSEETCWHP